MAWLLLHPLAHADASDLPPPTVETPAVSRDVETRLREYEIRLNAHRRELMKREAALEAARRRIKALTRAQAGSAAETDAPGKEPIPVPTEPAVSAPAPLAARPPSSLKRQPEERQDALAALRQELDAERENRVTLEREIQRLLSDPHSTEQAQASARLPAAAHPDAAGSTVELAPDAPAPFAVPPPSSLKRQPEEQQDALAALRQELDAERENRVTLEREIQRLLSDSRSTEQAQALARSLEGARAEILLLNHHLADERRAREALEVAIERVRSSAGISPGEDWIDRFESSMKERREQAERLEKELRDANESIVALRGKLEAVQPGAAVDPTALQDLESENRRLQQALEGAQQVNSALRAQADLASHLAELLYAQP